MPLLVALIAGILFGAGLTVAGMTNPRKILNFLDFAAVRMGNWDPTLLCVFAGALPVMFLAYRLAGQKPWLADAFQVPADGAIDRSLFVGSVMFGIGWGLVGLCPGPAVAALALASKDVMVPTVVFLSSLMAGIWLSNVVNRRA
jgi:uncharacterized protein